MKEFHPFTPTHAAVIVVFLLMTGALVTLRRRLAGTRAADRMDRVVAAAALAVWVFTTGGPFLPGIYDIHSSLPLQVCHLTNLLTPVALATCWRPARALSYFWGLALSTQGFFTPDLQLGPATLRFWMFWALHYQVVGAPIYDVAARGYRPTWKDWLLALSVGLAYVAVILPFDVMTGLNYGYIGRSKPGQPSLVDSLGPWPGRVAVMVGLAVVVMTSLMLPWDALRRWGRPAPAPDAASGAEPS